MRSFLSSAFLVITLVLFGFIFGGLFATRIMTTGGMGFDQIADALGGYTIGSAVALIAAIVLLRRLSPLTFRFTFPRPASAIGRPEDAHAHPIALHFQDLHVEVAAFDAMHDLRFAARRGAARIKCTAAELR
jgi:hypothetical protein